MAQTSKIPKPTFVASGNVVEVDCASNSVLYDTGNTLNSNIIVVTSIEKSSAANETMIPSVQGNRWIRGWTPNQFTDGEKFTIRYYVFSR